MEIKDILVDLILFIKEASPELWRILVKQVYVDGMQNMVGAVALSVFAVSLRKPRQNSASDEGEPELAGSVFVLVKIVEVLFILCITGLIVGFVSRMINPEFYAVQFILKSLAATN